MPASAAEFGNSLKPRAAATVLWARNAPWLLVLTVPPPVPRAPNIKQPTKMGNGVFGQTHA